MVGSLTKGKTELADTKPGLSGLFESKAVLLSGIMVTFFDLLFFCCRFVVILLVAGNFFPHNPIFFRRAFLNVGWDWATIVPKRI